MTAEPCERCYVNWYNLRPCIEKISQMPEGEVPADICRRALVPPIEQNLSYLAPRYQRWRPTRSKEVERLSTILIVESDLQLLKLLEFMLTRMGKFEVVGATLGGRNGIQRAKELRPDLVLTQGMMPDMTGWELAQVLSAEMPEIAIVIISPSCSHQHIRMAMEAGVDEYLIAPFMPNELIATLERVLADRAERYASRIAAYLDVLRRLNTVESVAAAAAWEERLGGAGSCFVSRVL